MKNKLLLLMTAVFVTSTVFGQNLKKNLMVSHATLSSKNTSSTSSLKPDVITCDTAYSLFPDVFPGDTEGVIYSFNAPATGYAFGTNSFKFTSCAETYDWSINKLKLNGATLFFNLAKFKTGHGTDTIAVRVFKTNKGGSKPTGLGLTEKSVTLSAIKANITAGHATKVKFPKTITMDTTHTWMINFTYKATGGDTINMVTGLFRGTGPFGYTNTWIKYPFPTTTQTWYSSSDTNAFADGISMWIGAWVCTPNIHMGPATESMVFNSGLEVSAYPNPSNTTFKLNIRSPKADPITVNVMDVTGRQVAVYNQLTANQIFEFGSNLNSGMYLVQVIQGSTIKSFKLNKN